MTNYKKWVLSGAVSMAATFGMCASASAGSILIINGASVSSEPGTTASITTNLGTVLAAAGNTTTIADTTPVSFSGYSQVWDLRFGTALTDAEQSQYLAYLQGGGGMFLMGENGSFMSRNNTILSLIGLAGGGTLNFTGVLGTQTVNPLFNTPGTIPGGTVSYAGPGGVDNAGTGQFITSDGVSGGTGVAFGTGMLANAAAGALTAIFDVNFMQGLYDQPNSQILLANLAGFVADEVEPPTGVPEPGSLALLGLGMIGLRAIRRRAAA